MASLSESVIRSALSQPSLGRVLLMQDIAEMERTERHKAELLGNPKKIDDIVATAAAEFSPMTKKVKDFTKYATKAEAVDANIPEEHPMKGFSQQLKGAYTAALGSKTFRGKSAGDILQLVARNALLAPDPKTGRTKLEGAFKYKRMIDAEWFEEEENYRKPPGYDLWLKAVREAEDAELASAEWFAGIDDYSFAAMMGAGFGAAFGAFTGGPAGAAAGAGTGAAINALLEVVAHPVRRAMMGTEWYRSKIHSDSGWEKVKALGGSFGVEVTAALASGSLASRGLRLALRKAAEKGSITAESFERFRLSGKAMDAIRLGEANREKLLAERVLMKAVAKTDRPSMYDAADAALEAATAPPEVLRARQSFADIISQIRKRKVGDAIAEQEKLAAAGVEKTRIAEAAREAAKREMQTTGLGLKPKALVNDLERMRGIKLRLPKPKAMFNKLSDEGAVKALDEGARTGSLDEAIGKTYRGERVSVYVNKLEAKDYTLLKVLTDKRKAALAKPETKVVPGEAKAVETPLETVAKEEAIAKAVKDEISDKADINYVKQLVDKKKAGKRIAKTDKARVILQRAGYTPEQIAAYNSTKVVRLAKKVRAERAAKRTAIDKTVKSEALETAGESGLPGVTAKEVGILGEEPLTTRTEAPFTRTPEEIIRAEEEATGETLTNIQRFKVLNAYRAMKVAAAQVDSMHTGRPNDALAKKLAGIGEELIPESRFPAEVPPARGQGMGGYPIEFSNVPHADIFGWDYMVDQMENAFLKKHGKHYLNWFARKTGGPEKNIPADVFNEMEVAWTALKKRFGSFEKATKADRRILLNYAKEQGLAGLQTDTGIKKLQKFFDGKNVPKLSLAGLLGVSLMEMLSPEEADAATLDSLAKTIPRVVGVLGKRAARREVKGEMYRLLKQMDAAELTAEPIAEGQKIFGRFQNQLDVDKMIIDDLGNMAKAVIRKKRLPLSTDRITDPATFSNMFYATGYGPAVQLATAQTAWGNNSMAGLTLLRNILADVPGYKPVGKQVAKAYEPLVEKYGTVQAARTVEVRIGQLENDIAGLYRQAEGKRVGPKTLESIDKSMADAESQLAVLRKERAAMQSAVDSFDRDWTATTKALASEHSSVRLALAAEDTADYTFYPWLKDLMTYEEKIAVGYIKDMMENYAVRHLELGHKVIEDRPFMHHVFHPKYSDKLAGEILDRIGVDLSGAIPFTKLFKRAKYSYQMVPDINYAMTRYIPDAERRIQMTRFWYGPEGNRNAKNTWFNHSRSDTVLGSEPLSAFWKRLETAYTPWERTGWNIWANRYGAFETFMLIGFAPATAFKHIFKNIGTWGQLGFRNAASHAPEAFSTAARNYINSPEVQKGVIVKGLKKLGLNPRARRKFMDEYVRSYTHQFRMLSASMDLELATPRGFGVWDTFDRLLYRANEKASILIRGVESFDRAHSMHAALDMAARMSLGKKGMTAKQATYGIFDTILKNNFLGAGLNPRWMQNPVIRAMLLFQNTPFKILERRLVNASKAMKDVKTAAGVIKAQDIGTTLKQLADMKNYILKGESLLKQNLIADAFTQSRDFFGTPYTKQFFREFMYGGMVVWGLGGIMDADFMPHTFHLPFLSTFGGDKPQLAVSPFVGAGYKILQGWMRPSDRADQEEFWLSEFMDDWLGKKQLIPQTAYKVLRMSDNDIPEIYQGSKLAYLFSVPAKH